MLSIAFKMLQSFQYSFRENPEVYLFRIISWSDWRR